MDIMPSKNSRSKNTVLNVLFGYGVQICILILSFVNRRIFLIFLHVDYLGINGLFTNILTILALAELGLDSSVVYTLYKPVSENNYPLIHSLLSYFKKIYYSITVLILIVGLALIPFLRFIISTDLPICDVVVYYVLFLINNVASYFVAHKVALISAFQEQRIQKVISLATTGFLQIAHIIVLFVARNYFVYVATTLVFTFINNFIISVVCKRRYRAVFENNERVPFDKKPILNRIKSAFLYKIGAVAVNNTDNILISALVSTNAVGFYSNYCLLTTAVQGFISIVNSSLISSIGNLAAGENKKRQLELFYMFLLFYHCLAAICGIGFALLFNNFISIWLGAKYVLSQSIVYVIASNFYVSNLFAPVWIFREANGLFEKVRYLVLIRAICNLLLSIVLGKVFGTFGILLATVLSLLLTIFWYEPKIIFSVVFDAPRFDYWKKQIKYFVITFISFGVSYYISGIFDDSIVFLPIKAIIIVFITIGLFFVVNIKTKELSTLKLFLDRTKLRRITSSK